MNAIFQTYMDTIFFLLFLTGDTKAVIQFASISRDPEIYKLAANYLQQMNWRESVDILKAITTFYTKAKAFVQLAAFYDSCGQVKTLIGCVLCRCVILYILSWSLD